MEDAAHARCAEAADRDPVCGMKVDPATSSITLVIADTPITSARAVPEKVLGQSRIPYHPPARHPRRHRRGSSTPARCIRRSAQDGPGSCPICGMALEPLDVRRRGRAEPRARRHDPALLDRARARRCRWSRWKWAVISRARPAPPRRRRRLSTWMQFAARHAGRAVGGLALLRARLGVGREPQPQHVHA